MTAEGGPTGRQIKRLGDCVWSKTSENMETWASTMRFLEVRQYQHGAGHVWRKCVESRNQVLSSPQPKRNIEHWKVMDQAIGIQSRREGKTILCALIFRAYQPEQPGRFGPQKTFSTCTGTRNQFNMQFSIQARSMSNSACP